jgi:hypothetical protein
MASAAYFQQRFKFNCFNMDGVFGRDRFLVTDYGSVEQLKYEGGYMSTATPILASPNVCRILSLDGGGAKGFYTLGVLKQVEAMLGGEPLCAAA